MASTAVVTKTENSSEILQMLVIYIQGALVWALGPLDKNIEYLLLIVLIDTIFAINVAKVKGTFSFKIMVLKTADKLMIYFLWISMSHAFEVISGMTGARYSILLSIITIEVVSALRNTSQSGRGQIASVIMIAYKSILGNFAQGANSFAQTLFDEKTQNLSNDGILKVEEEVKTKEESNSGGVVDEETK
jgi:phage-related holin